MENKQTIQKRNLYRLKYMANDVSFLNNYMYNSIVIERYFYSLPLWRRLIARFFEKFKITKEEYDNWFDKQLLQGK